MDLGAHASRRFLVVSSVAMILAHFSLWALLAAAPGASWGKLLTHWDAGWYELIIKDGYGGIEWAFYPLYPLLVRGISQGLGLLESSAFVGTALSIALFAGAVAIWVRRADRTEPTQPASRAAWLIFLFSPASFAFHSHHTEALFLLLTLGGLLLLAEGRWLTAAVLAGLAALTRNQGVLFSIAIASGAAIAGSSTRERFSRFVTCGLISGALFALYPLYQWFDTGNPLAFAEAQNAWRKEISGASYFRTFWFGNPWQTTNMGAIQRHVLFFILAASIVFVWRRNKTAGLYTALSVAIMPMPGEFVGVFRYGAVLFPALFVLGDRVAKLPRPVGWLLLLGVLYLNHHTTRSYGLSRWAY